MFDVAFSPDGSRLARSSELGPTEMWDIAPAAPARRRPGSGPPGGQVVAVAFSPDGEVLAQAERRRDGSGRVTLLRSSDLDPIGTFTFSGAGDGAEKPTGVAFSPDGRMLAVPVESGKVALIPRAGGEPIRLPGHVGGAQDARFSPDGATVATGGADGRVRLWSVADGRQLDEFSIGIAVRDVAFSPDGAVLAATGQQNVWRLWDVAGRQPLANLDQPSDAINDMHFDDGGRLVTAQVTGLVRVTDLVRTGPPGRSARRWGRTRSPPSGGRWAPTWAIRPAAGAERVLSGVPGLLSSNRRDRPCATNRRAPR